MTFEIRQVRLAHQRRLAEVWRFAFEAAEVRPRAEGEFLFVRIEDANADHFMPGVAKTPERAADGGSGLEEVGDDDQQQSAVETVGHLIDAHCNSGWAG